MHKRLFPFLLVCLSLRLVAQVDSLGKPNLAETASATSALYQLQDFLNQYAGEHTEEDRKAVALKLIKESIASVNVALPNDLGVDEKKTLPLMAYAKQLSEASKGNWSIQLTHFKTHQLAFDKLRRKHFLVVRADKITTVESIEEGTGDTLVEDIVQPLLFYYRFDRVQNISSHFRIFAVAKPGEEFALEPLSEQVQWWLALEKPWKDFLRKAYKLPEFPSEVELIHLLNRTQVALTNTTLTSIEPLRKFSRLEIVDLRKSNIADLSPLADFVQLRELYIEGSKTSSLNGLEKLRHLQKLTASKMGLTSVEPLRNLLALEELDLSENDIEDITPLEGLVNLRKLNLSLNSKIRNVQPLARMHAIQELSLAKIDIKNLDVLKEMKYLDKLNIFNTGITTLEPLRGFSNLSVLDCGFNVVSSLDPIKDMKFIQHLNVAGTAVTDLNVLGNFKFLKRLDCSNNPRLTSLGPVIGLEDVEELKCFYTKIDKNEVQQFKRKHVRCKITFY